MRLLTGMTTSADAKLNVRSPDAFMTQSLAKLDGAVMQ
jgi:hypothetical protein